MKGTLLVLALLVTRQLTDACPLFYGVFGAVNSGSEFLLNLSLDFVNATEAEKEGLKKLQDCYNDLGLVTKILDLILTGSVTVSKECISQSVDMFKKDVEKVFKPIGHAVSNVAKGAEKVLNFVGR